MLKKLLFAIILISCGVAYGQTKPSGNGTPEGTKTPDVPKTVDASGNTGPVELAPADASGETVHTDPVKPSGNPTPEGSGTPEVPKKIDATAPTNETPENTAPVE